MPSSISAPKLAKKSIHERRHGHAQYHESQKERRDLEKKAVGDMVVATINGNVVSWINQYDGHELGQASPTPAPAPVSGPPAAPPAAAPAPAPAPPTQEAQPAPAAAPAQAVPAASDPSPVAKPAINNKFRTSPEAVARGDWAQVGYYNSEEKSAHGITFLNNQGGQGSGVFDMSVQPFILASRMS
jgi:hypothetical protein